MATPRKKAPRKSRAGKPKPVKSDAGKKKKASPPKRPAPKLPKKKAPKRRDYRAEYRKRVEREKALAKAQGREFSRSVARGHPRRGKGEIGANERRQLKMAMQATAKIPSPGEARLKHVPYTATMRSQRIWARQEIARMVGLELPVPDSTEGTRKGKRAERFAEAFMALGLGTEHQAYSLYLSP